MNNSRNQHDPSRTRARRDAIVAYMASYSTEHGRGPTIREIMAAVGITSTSVTRYHLAWLARHGEIEWEPRINRGGKPLGAELIQPGDAVQIQTDDGHTVTGQFVGVAA